ncbi:Ribosomal large subunit pseudouridine synthase A [Pseudoalteromonas sp. P1-9]|uniref:bifunctional tRNA pseudouridine(32) synthase/23S rRNA pseudouridine(746) synthase RluA n=1 Tax=Pseudoalteromonas sp. P1-9 TaxID=1710354 RepID=UPI0006D631F1|nr:bifunctional tRNA pseudouridine(32) synthase/23S rRNA pseudouridine(746) synthase RluA [Pseudoalteromonas sp. P1-9]KPV95757.1 Ribosomal large subunit pseudouridine synthase A [Pseudoalteromonas sp. P1-9]
MLLNYNPPTSPYINILYRDDDLIILNKPSGLLTVPGKALEHKDSLINRVNLVFPTATIVHRLDMATSGIICLALNKATHREISRQFQDRETKKRYIARVYGKLEPETGSVDLPLICDWPNRPKQMVDHERGKPSLTHYEVLSYEEHATRVALTPITGRSHQLRVHMLSLGHVILGDRLYAHDDALAMATRLQLHAQYLSFTHPVTKQQLSFYSDPDF